MKSCCFTGHRNIKEIHQKILLYRLIETLENCINDGVTDFYSGGAIDWDTLSAKTVYELKYKHIKLHLILPCSKDKQTSMWSENQKIDFDNILKMADTIEYVSNNYYNGCMKARNQSLINNADICICYFDHENFRSGTGQTVRMALKKGILIINLRF